MAVTVSLEWEREGHGQRVSLTASEAQRACGTVASGGQEEGGKLGLGALSTRGGQRPLLGGLLVAAGVKPKPHFI